jgi:hypothetical protein
MSGRFGRTLRRICSPGGEKNTRPMASAPYILRPDAPQNFEEAPQNFEGAPQKSGQKDAGMRQ